MRTKAEANIPNFGGSWFGTQDPVKENDLKEAIRRLKASIR